MSDDNDKTLFNPEVTRRGFLTAAGLGAAALATGSIPQIVSAKQTVKIGDKGFTEEFLVADMYQLLLAKHGIPVERHSFKTVFLAQAAITSGRIDLYPEYTGTGLLEVLKMKPMFNAKKLYNVVKAQYQKRYHLTWLDPAPMNDTNAVALKHDTAAKYGIKTMSQLASVSNQLSFACLAECVGRADCLVGLKNTYGMNFKQVITTTSPALNYSALLSGKADVSEVFSTDGQIAANNLVVPVDNKHLWPPYQIAPVVRDDTLKAYPQIAQILNKLAPYITTHAISRLNALVDLHNQDHMKVARSFLKSKGLL